MTFFVKLAKITVMESWQSGNAADSKSADPVHPGAQVQILYSPYEETRRTPDYIRNAYISRVLVFFNI